GRTVSRSGLVDAETPCGGDARKKETGIPVPDERDPARRITGPRIARPGHGAPGGRTGCDLVGEERVRWADRIDGSPRSHSGASLRPGAASADRAPRARLAGFSRSLMASERVPDVRRRLGPAPDPELLQKVVDVVLHGRLGDVEGRRDLLVREASLDMREDFLLSPREAAVRSRYVLGVGPALPHPAE